MTTCWEYPENAAKHPEGYKPKISIDEVKKRMLKAIKSKTELHRAYIEVNKFSFIYVDIKSENEGSLRT